MATPSPASSFSFHSPSHLNPPIPTCGRPSCTGKTEGYPRRLSAPVLIDLTADTPSPPVPTPEPLHHYPQFPHLHTQPHLHHQGSAFYRVSGASNSPMPAFQSNGQSTSHPSCPYLRWQHSREHSQRVNNFPNSAFGPPLTHQPQPFYHPATPTSGPVLIDLEHCDNSAPDTSMTTRPVLVSTIPVVAPTFVPTPQPHSHQHPHHPPVHQHPPSQPMEHSHQQSRTHGESLPTDDSSQHYHYHHHHHHHHYTPFQYQLSQPQIQPVTHFNYPPPLQHHVHHHQVPVPTLLPRPGNPTLFPHAVQASQDMLLHLLSSMVTMPQPPPPHPYPGWEEGTNQEQYETLLNIAEQIGEAKPRGLTKRDIERLLTYRVKDDGEKNENDGRCVICLMEFEQNDQLRVLPCLHEYHVKCIDKWLRSNRTCPICRSRVTVPQNA